MRYLLALLFILTFLSSNDIFTKNEKQWIKNNTVSIGIEQWEPIVYINKNNKVDGISGDVLDLIIKNSGLKVEYISNDWSSLLSDFKSNKIDILPATYFTEERSTYGVFTKEYFKIKEYIYLRQDNNSIKSFDDLKNKKIAIIRDYGTIPKIKEKYPSIKIIETKDTEESLNFVLEKKVDAYIDVQIGVENYINKNLIVGIKGISQSSFKPSPIHFFINKDKEILKSIINKSMNMISDSKKGEIISKWLYSTNNQISKLSHLKENEIKYIKNHKIIKMCNNPNWEPIEFLHNGKPKGIIIDLLSEIEKKLDVKFEHVKSRSWVDSQNLLKEKKCDILPAATPTSKRKKYAKFTDTHLIYKLAIITKNDKPFVRNLNEIIDKPMTRKKGSGLISKLKKTYPNINIIETSGYEESLKKVSNGDVYYTIATLPVASHFISKFGLFNLHIAGYTEMKFDLSMAVRDDKEILSDILSKTINTISKHDIAKIEDKWSRVAINQTRSSNYKLMVQVFIVILFVVMFLIYRQIQLNKHHVELKETNEKFKKMLTSTIEAILIIKDDKVLECNHSAVRMFGYKNIDKLVGQNIFDLVDKNSKKIIRKKLDSELSKEDEVKLLKSDGSVFPAIMQSTNFDTSSEHIKLVAIIDITDIKKKEELLLHSSKMAQMGEMIGNIAHQWRQPLNVITTAATGIKIKKEYEILEEGEMEDLLNSITNNANYLSDTIDTFRNFIKEKVELKTVIIQDRVDYALNIIDTRLSNSHITLHKNLHYDQMIYIKIVMGELTQVLINIINNAVDILLEKKIEDKWIKIDLQIYTKKVILTVEDNGGGIPIEVLPKIFDPYFTTKHQAMGTGIGLYMSYDIVVNHLNGKLYAKNSENGAKFYIELPIEN